MGEYLYSIGAEWRERAAEARAATQARATAAAAATFVNPTSERLMGRLKGERFK